MAEASSVALLVIDVQEAFHNAVKDTFPEFESIFTFYNGPIYYGREYYRTFELCT